MYSTKFLYIIYLHNYSSCGIYLFLYIQQIIGRENTVISWYICFTKLVDTYKIKAKIFKIIDKICR